MAGAQEAAWLEPRSQGPVGERRSRQWPGSDLESHGKDLGSYPERDGSSGRVWRRGETSDLRIDRTPWAICENDWVWGADSKSQNDS